MNDQTRAINLSKNTRINRLSNNMNIGKNYGSNTPDLDNNQDCKNSVIILNTSNAKALGLNEEEIAQLELESKFLTTIRLVISRSFQKAPFIS
ncbi:MAG: hypothetical protein ACRC80_29330 [Waterburya sp.]